MNLELLDAEIREHFTPDCRASLLDLTREAYDRAMQRYSPMTATMRSFSASRSTSSSPSGSWISAATPRWASSCAARTP
jgi:hypothetical protein